MKPLLLSLLFAPVLAATAQPLVVVAYAPPASSTVLGSTFVDWDSLAVRRTDLGQVRQVFDNPTPTLEKLESHITTLNPGMSSHPVHRHPWEEVIYLREGTLDVFVAGRKLHAVPGSLIFLASNDPHNLTNTGSTPATYYIVDFYTGLEQTVPDKSAAEQSIPGKLVSTVIDCNSLPTTPTPTGSRVSVVGSPTLTFNSFESHITTLNPGQSTAKDMLDSGDEVAHLQVRLRRGAHRQWRCQPHDRRPHALLGTQRQAHPPQHRRHAGLLPGLQGSFRQIPQASGKLNAAAPSRLLPVNLFEHLGGIRRAIGARIPCAELNKSSMRLRTSAAGSTSVDANTQLAVYLPAFENPRSLAGVG